jgi:hypothetical protein
MIKTTSYLLVIIGLIVLLGKSNSYQTEYDDTNNYDEQGKQIINKKNDIDLNKEIVYGEVDISEPIHTEIKASVNTKKNTADTDPLAEEMNMGSEKVDSIEKNLLKRSQRIDYLHKGLDHNKIKQKINDFHNEHSLFDTDRLNFDMDTQLFDELSQIYPELNSVSQYEDSYNFDDSNEEEEGDRDEVDEKLNFKPVNLNIKESAYSEKDYNNNLKKPLFESDKNQLGRRSILLIIDV